MIPTNEEARNFVNNSLSSVLSEGLTNLCKEKPVEPIVSFFQEITISLNFKGLACKLVTCK